MLKIQHQEKEINKMKMNKKMQKLLTLDVKGSDKFCFIQESLQDLLMPSFQSVFDCIIISKEVLEFESEEEFLKIIKDMYTDKTGYEASVTDTLLNYYLEDEYLTLGELLSLSLIIIKLWEKQLKLITKKSKFCFIVSGEVETNFVTIRFHQFREDEGMWLLEDLEKYDAPIGYKIV